MQFSVLSGPRKQVADPIETEPFILSKQTESAPSIFEIIFIIKDDERETKYRYGFSVNKEQVLSENLYMVKNVREVLLFSRNSQEIEYTQYFREGSRGKQSVRNNCSLLSVCAQNNGAISTQIIKYFRKISILSGLYDPFFPNNDNITPAYKEKIIKFLKNADIQITNFKTEPVSFPDNELSSLIKNKFPDFQMEKRLFGHTVYDGNVHISEHYFDENEESAGTQKLFFYSTYILEALEFGAPLFIDEFDSTLHPLIIENIIKLFNSSITNPNNAQLIISCHAVNIMTNKNFRRDQIWFCEKDEYGATDMYSLVDYKKESQDAVRKDSSYNKNYLQGKYGAIPYINDIL
jgi:AAA15 family ATPase/GTPase